ncbi:MAG: phosphohydrolase [unclassified Hahellaceae]|nr:phosphohydrolase [Hahellaceae bacterium]|tara:strand:- start:90425 stop:91555 length:1131 start_codon:yes stop_codon:yes gene_type:complete
MADFKKLIPGALYVGKPLPWPVYDEQGGFLLSQGHVIQSEYQLELLYKRGMFQKTLQSARAHNSEERQEGRRVSPFAEYAPLLEDLEAGLHSVLVKDPRASQKILILAKRIADMCASDPDACIALVHIYSVEPTAYEQVLFYAILCCIIGQRLNFIEKRTILLAAAALSANIALLPHQDKLNNSKLALTEAQRAIINKHPLLSVAALQAAGVEQPRYLRIIEQHHEVFNGTGYPNGLNGDEILPEAKALALAERYTAMVTRRAYRDRYCCDQARLEILQAYAEDPDQSVYNALFDGLGDFPPGSLVTIQTGETAVITRQRKGAPPFMQAVVSAKGNAYMGGLKRDSLEAEFTIVGVVVPKVLPTLNLDELWSYNQA